MSGTLGNCNFVVPLDAGIPVNLQPVKRPDADLPHMLPFGEEFMRVSPQLVSHPYRDYTDHFAEASGLTCRMWNTLKVHAVCVANIIHADSVQYMQCCNRLHQPAARCMI